MVNLALLACGVALFWVATQLYFKAEENVLRNTPLSLRKAESEYGWCFAYCIFGTVPLLFGIRGEVKRKSEADRRLDLKRRWKQQVMKSSHRQKH